MTYTDWCGTNVLLSIRISVCQNHCRNRVWINVSFINSRSHKVRSTSRRVHDPSYFQSCWFCFITSSAKSSTNDSAEIHKDSELIEPTTKQLPQTLEEVEANNQAAPTPQTSHVADSRDCIIRRWLKNSAPTLPGLRLLNSDIFFIVSSMNRKDILFRLPN